MNRVLRIGTRGSALALVQANWVAERLREHGVGVEVVIIRTAGDERAPDTAWGEGAFVTAIESALLDASVDIAVHSAKDVPTDENPLLTICAWTAREDAHDALVCRVRGTTLATLPAGARVGTDSPRRSAFLRARRPDLVVHQLSGNVDTRLRKLDDGQSDALVLAVAGLTRLGRADRIDEILPFEVAVPAPGQGALALQTRTDDGQAIDALSALDDPASRICVQAERAFLAATGGGCRSPIGAYGEINHDQLTLHVAAERETGGDVLRLARSAPAAEWHELAVDLARDIVRGRSPMRVVITRPHDAAAPLAQALRGQGIEPVVIPTIEIVPETGDALDAGVSAAVSRGAWIVATSSNGVSSALGAFDRLGLQPSSVRWGVVGQASAAPLRERGVSAFVPSRALGATLATELPVGAGDHVLVVRGDLGDPAMSTALRARHADVVDVVAYRTHEAPSASRDPLAEALRQRVDVVMFASGSAVRGALQLADDGLREKLLRTPVVCIGPTTGEVALTAGFATVREADDPATDSVMAAITAVRGGS